MLGRCEFSEKAQIEMDADALTELDVVESILSAAAVFKRLRSRSPHRRERREYLYVIQSRNLSGLAIYSKGKLVRMEDGRDSYFLVFIETKHVLAIGNADVEVHSLPELWQHSNPARAKKLAA